MKSKYLFWTAIIYTILLSLNGSTGFAGAVWNAAYYFCVAAMWLSLFFFALIIGFLAHPVVQSKLKVNPSNLSLSTIYVTTAIGFVIAGIWIYLDSPWMALGQTIFVVESFFLKSYMVAKK